MGLGTRLNRYFTILCRPRVTYIIMLIAHELNETYSKYYHFLWKVYELLEVEIVVGIKINWREFLIHPTLRVPPQMMQLKSSSYMTICQLPVTQNISDLDRDRC